MFYLFLCLFQVFEGHTHYVMQIVINPKDNNQFASASLDRTIKVRMDLLLSCPTGCLHISLRAGTPQCDEEQQQICAKLRLYITNISSCHEGLLQGCYEEY